MILQYSFPECCKSIKEEDIKEEDIKEEINEEESVD